MDQVLTSHTIDRIRAFLARPTVSIPGASRARVDSLIQLYELSVGLSGQDYLLRRERMNDTYDIDAFLADINAQMRDGQYYIGCANCMAGYRTKVFTKGLILPRFGLRQLAFIFHRVMPKFKWGAGLYKYLMRGRSKRMCKTEILGRLAYAGFRIEKVRQEGEMLFYRVVKKSAPLEGYTPTYGPLIKLKRVVKGGKLVNIYKLRTMHPYAEFIQDYVYEENDLDVGGKIKDDFRVSEEGKIFRKLFLDELPMLINLVKGDIKLVGVRPLSEHYLSLYTENIRRERLKVKPGLLPPFYSEDERPGTIEEVMVSEMRYLIEYRKSPWRTDMRYLIKIMDNILRKKFRSK